MAQALTPQDKQIAQRAFADIVPLADTLGLLFYARLFELDPALRELFHVDLQDQAHTIMTMLQLCMDNLDERAELRHALRTLGARHAEYHIRMHDYATVQSALLWAFQQGLGADWTPDVERSMKAVLELFVEEMQKGTMSVIEARDRTASTAASDL